MTHSTEMPNRLINENSPYLLQHAYNPVDWWPWCDEAFAKAKAEDKPVFLSIGYSTCHWCHVMAHECFEDEAVAAVLNEYFVPVKVDREQRPDVDSVYMAVCQSLSGQGGWPLTVLTTPEQQPFYTATYVPPQQLIQLAEQIGEEWQRQPQSLRDRARRVSDFFTRRLAQAPCAPQSPDRALPAQSYAELAQRFDARYGGFGSAPKFPLPHDLLFLLAWYKRDGDKQALKMATHTLDMMYRGGIYDHVGGGFARYATDTRWLIPHFEKMLYDNALLLPAYAEAYRITGTEHYKRVALSIVEWLQAEMLRDGAYCAAQDADTAAGEGAYYVWSEAEIDEALGAGATDFKARYDVTARGNFEGANILNLLSCPRWREMGESTRQQLSALYGRRRVRMALHTDDKILTGWNALLLAALARSAGALGEPSLLDMARGLWHYMEEELFDTDGRPLAGRRAGHSLGKGRLDDHAFLLWAVMELDAGTGGQQAGLVQRAEQLAGQLKQYFWDEERGGFFLTAADGEQLIFRPKDYYDGALPSGNAVAAYGLLLLERQRPGEGWRELALRALAAAGLEARSYVSGHCFAMLAQLEL